MTFDKYTLDHSFPFLVADISRLITAEYNRVMKPLGLTRAQWGLLVHLHRADGLTQSDLANLLQVGKVSIGGLVDRLEHGDWLERRADPEDRRTNRIYLTKKGRGIEKRLEKAARELVHRILHNLNRDERTQLIDLLVDIKSNLLETSSEHDSTKGD